MTAKEQAADALRRHEQPGRKLNAWHIVSLAHRKRWLKKVEIVLSAYTEAIDAALAKDKTK